MGVTFEQRIQQGAQMWRQAFIEKNAYGVALGYWGPLMVLMYTVVPLRWCNLFNDLCGLVYSVIVSYLVNV